MQGDDGAGLGAGGDERAPGVGVHGRQGRVRGYLRQGDRPHPAGGVAPDLHGGQLRVPQRDQPAARGGPAPLLDHPVVVGAHAQQGELAVGGLGGGLPAEAGEGGETQGGPDVADVHVGEAGGHVVGAGPHLLAGDHLQADLAVAADGGVQPGQGAVQVLVDPPVAERAVVARRAHHGLEAPAEGRHLLQRGAHDPGAGVAVLPRQPVPPDARRLHGVVVDGDDPGERGACALTCLHGGHGSAVLTARQVMWRPPRTRRRGDITAPRHAESCKDLVNQERPRVIGVSHG